MHILSVITKNIVKLLHMITLVFVAVSIASIIYIVINGLNLLSSAMFIIFIYLFGITLGTAGKIEEKEETKPKILLEWIAACLVGAILLTLAFLFS